MAEQQSEHRQKLESIVIEGDSRRADRGNVFAFIIAMTTVVGAIVLLAFGKNIAGFSSLVIGIGSIVATFLKASRDRRKERMAKYGKDVA